MNRARAIGVYRSVVSTARHSIAYLIHDREAILSRGRKGRALP